MTMPAPKRETTPMTDVVTDAPAAPDPASPEPPAAVRSRNPVRRIAASGFGRIAGISASLVGTQALTSVLGLAFWAVAARQFAAGDVGVAGAAIAMMMLLGSLGSLGFGTLLIARLPHTAAADRRVLVRTCLGVAAAAGTLLGLVVPALAVHVFGAANLAPIAGEPAPLLLLAVGTGLTSVVMVLDQAVLTIGMGTLQLERNVASSAVKLVALLALGLLGVHGGMTIFGAWAIGNVLSLPIVSWRTRGGRSVAAGRRMIEPTMLRGLGRLAVSHHALNVSIQAALQLLPVIVTVLVSAEQNSRFNAAIMISGFVFALPYAVSVGLFAAARGDETEVVERMRLTIPFGLAVSATASLVLLPLAEPVLQIFGAAYAAEGAVLLRLIVLAGLPFVIKDHFIALRRVQGRTSEALVVTTLFLVLELAAASAGAVLGGAVGLCVGWLVVLGVEALLLTVPLVSAYRHRASVTTAARTAAPVDAVVPADIAVLPDETATAVAPPRGLSAEPRAEDTALVQRGLRFRRNLAGPTLTIIALGVVVMAAAANIARTEDSAVLPQVIWFAGLLLVFVPAAVRILAAATPRTERLVVAVGLGMILQVSRLVINPTLLVFHDELIHAETLRQIDQTGHLFSFNPLLPVSAYYPGLEMVTNAVERLTGLPAFPSAVAVLLAARLVILLAILLLVGAVTGSRRAGAVGVLIYVTNPQFLFFNSQYSYQTLALPLAVLCIALLAVRRSERRGSLLVPLAAAAGVVVTHHLTAVLLIAALAVWFLLVVIRGRASTPSATRAEQHARRRAAVRDTRDLAVTTVWTVLVFGLSVVNPGNPLNSYLGAIAGSSVTDVLDLTEGQQTKALFADTAGTGPAPIEQVLLIAAVLLSTASVLVALGFIRTAWRGARPLALLVGLVAAIYPVIPGGHLTRATAEVGDRAAGFVFVGIAVVLGAWWWRKQRRRLATTLFVAACTITFLGDIVLGAGPTSGQLPGTYQVSADSRSVDADNLAAAEWLTVGVPRDSIVYGDRVSGALASAYGGQQNVMHVSTGIDASRLLLAPTYTSEDRALIRRADLDYLLVDQRLSGGLPHQQVYIESGEYDGQNRRKPVSAAALEKFRSVPDAERVYDNGSVAIYDVRGLR